ncbi:MAG: hypothetical protein SVV80_05230 [Planctomycetota bacterium]|nr:hypothetical protein [Planctomycetota bacterium]
MTNDTEDSGSVVRPLNEAWWTRDDIEEFPPDDVPILAPYEKTRPGFELVVAKTLKDVRDMDCFPVSEDGNQQICLWNIWEQKKDPAEADEDKQKINEMQRSLDQLCDDDRYVRLQISCLQRCFWTFPGNVDMILDGIASGRVNLDAGISCEPPWTTIRALLDHRRHRGKTVQKDVSGCFHHLQGRDPITDPRQKLIFAYIKVLTWWGAEGDMNYLKREMAESADLAETVYRYLGLPTRLKRLYVQKLCWTLGFWAFPSQSAHESRWKGHSEITEVFNVAIRQELGDEEDTIGKLIDRNNDNGSCHHSFFRHIDHIIAHIGAGRPVTLPGAGEERKRIHEAVTNYIHVLGSWLAGRTPEEAISIWPPCEETVRHVYDVLDNPTPPKRWLVACLWKKLQENQAHHGRGALDEQPDRFALPPDALKVLQA